ncbi:MAG: RDD family protein [Methylobacter sp.]|nr:RDD family protein [Methylobacter sp.]MDP2428125.1 RDD family protein [Methylobacter sp.]MDP3054407.1 RDD family protein [Methylobacter sp.]MDP3360894.1 RDD family protein [Methylobacter sp.]MDZ4220021.1 RDD family protein [Methylobacter sp.]
MRRLAVILYDVLLLIALLFVATALVLPLNAGEAFTAQQFYFPLYLLLVSFFFYAWFWTHGGQTLGLRAWKIRVLTLDRQPISWKQAALRFSLALFSWFFFGLGFWWILIDKDRRSWHDRFSKTALFFDTPDLHH